MLPSAPANLRQPLAGLWIDALQRSVKLGMRDRSNQGEGSSPESDENRAPFKIIFRFIQSERGLEIKRWGSSV
jgi:hypothetical protein